MSNMFADTPVLSSIVCKLQMICNDICLSPKMKEYNKNTTQILLLLFESCITKEIIFLKTPTSL